MNITTLSLAFIAVLLPVFAVQLLVEVVTH
jgi:hypothetical protein